MRTRTLEAYAKHYTMAWPFEEYRSARPLRVSPLYQRLKDQGACFGEKLGWERPNWFAPPGVEPKDVYTYGRQNWFPYVATEHQACRERVALFDQTSFAKFLVIGKDAERALQWICANDVGKPPGSLTYTQMLNARGGIECDLTVARLSATEYYIVTGTGFATHDFAWIRRNIPPDCADAALVDVTSAYCVLALMGPSARDVLAQVTHADLSNAAFPFGAWREIDVAGALVRALRVTYVGELGWELHIPVESALVVYERLMEAGRQHGIVNAGYRAIESLRLEKGYRAWGSDIGPDHTPLEAGLRPALARLGVRVAETVRVEGGPGREREDGSRRGVEDDRGGAPRVDLGRDTGELALGRVLDRGAQREPQRRALDALGGRFAAGAGAHGVRALRGVLQERHGHGLAAHVRVVAELEAAQPAIVRPDVAEDGRGERPLGIAARGLGHERDSRQPLLRRERADAVREPARP